MFTPTTRPNIIRLRPKHGAQGTAPFRNIVAPSTNTVDITFGNIRNVKYMFSAEVWNIKNEWTSSDNGEVTASDTATTLLWKLELLLTL